MGLMTVVLWVLFSVAAGVLANRKGRSGFGYFLLSIVLSPLVGLLFAAVVSDLSAKASAGPVGPNADTHVKCPHCAEFVLPEATVCKHCRGALEARPHYAASVAAARKATAKQDARTELITVGVVVAVGLGVLWLVAG